MGWRMIWSFTNSDIARRKAAGEKILRGEFPLFIINNRAFLVTHQGYAVFRRSVIKQSGGNPAKFDKLKAGDFVWAKILTGGKKGNGLNILEVRLPESAQRLNLRPSQALYQAHS